MLQLNRNWLTYVEQVGHSRCETSFVGVSC